MPASPTPVLVTGATGNQGGAVARALLATGVPVHALVRNPNTESAAALANLGAVLVHGDLDDITSLAAALVGVNAVFSVQTSDVTDPTGDSEIQRGDNLVKAARSAGVEHFVHTSVAGTAAVDVEHFDEARYGAITRQYYHSKAAVEELVRAAGFPQW
ncbi:NmrA family NAD(P)-binding protein, partial [Micromonospora qiuiae]|uniref:NmrA family NAD(P)-binding protein n=1 Tax=Micromonospora qiuiae TaxID=502268 RepID=UPI00194E34F8